MIEHTGDKNVSNLETSKAFLLKILTMVGEAVLEFSAVGDGVMNRLALVNQLNRTYG